MTNRNVLSDDLLSCALRSADETRALALRPGALADVAEIFSSQFGPCPALIVADVNTFAVAGKATLDMLRRAGFTVPEPFVFEDADLHAEYPHVDRLDRALAATDVIPVAVGSGTINDLTKLAAHHNRRPYMSVATAASMDGYTAFGASITHRGSKQTFDCPAPRAVVADTVVLAAAPPEMNAAGYADLLAKITAGADWMLADAMGFDPIDPAAWDMVQRPLREWLSDPAGVRGGDQAAISRLTTGLLVAGFAMQRTKMSRPASGAEHHFSHLWDMEHHTHEGRAPSHGFKVAIGTLAVSRLYEQLLPMPLDALDVHQLIAACESPASLESRIRSLFDLPELAELAVAETSLKQPSREKLREHLLDVRSRWPGLAVRLRRQLGSTADLSQMLSAVGAPTEPGQIGISADRLRRSFRKACYTRRRYTVLDLAERAGVLDRALERMFDPTEP
jgi:glycerol-1-phosphate dehydrogenase [NAD(P)+]